jgi:phosphoesterase RecJ-like protein
VTDTGKFMYENTDPDSHRMAAELIEAGVNVDEIYRRLYERVPIEKAKLVARAIEKIERFDGGRLALTYVSREDYAATGASDLLTEGIIDHVRALEGTVVAGVVRDKTEGGRTARKVSLRSSDGAVDVSAIAREQGGGGHVRAAGFGTDLAYPELVEFLRAQVAKQLD